ncbi:hypothetical protein EDB86DRAFT_2832785 [Lactarius hatsudake]|nr:hypothetical protein EDB86DRAFT_2832785 [Lactarius hatsudake]
MSILLTNNNPLEHSDYFLGPVETIAYSHDALTSGRLSLHDITEAYHTLSMRIRHSSSTLTVGTRTFTALELLRQKGADVVSALRRDISWALHGSTPRIYDDSSFDLSGSTERTTSGAFIGLFSNGAAMAAVGRMEATGAEGHILSWVVRAWLRILRMASFLVRATGTSRLHVFGALSINKRNDIGSKQGKFAHRKKFPGP